MQLDAERPNEYINTSAEGALQHRRCATIIIKLRVGWIKEQQLAICGRDNHTAAVKFSVYYFLTRKTGYLYAIIRNESLDWQY